MSGVEIRVRSNSQQARQDLARLEKSVGNIDKTVNNVTKSIGRLAVGLGAAFSAQLAIRNINKYTDSLINLENRIALVTGRTEEMTQVLGKLYEISARSRGSIDGAAETFNRFGRSLQGTGASTEQLLQVTEAVQKSIAISGSGAESARAAIFQLGQGLASGQLRGQELNSVLEQAPRLAQAIADSMGQPLGKLRELAEEGKITTDVVFKGLLKQAEAINKEFADLEGTTAQAFEVFGDSVGRVTGEISKTLGFSYLFTDQLNRMSTYLRDNVGQLNSMAFILRGDIITGFRDFSLIAGGVANVLGAYFGRIGDAIYQLILPMRTVSDQLKATLLSPFLEARQEYLKITNKIGDDMADSMMSGLRGKIGNVFRAEGPEEIRAALDDLAMTIDGYGRQWFNFGNQITNFINPAFITIERTLVGLGILDQRLLRFRSGSFEDLNFVMELTNLIIKDLVKNIKALEVWNDLVLGAYIAAQQINRVMGAIKSEISIAVNKIQKTLQSMFTGVKDIAEKNLGAAWKSVKGYLDLIERKFFWLYDEVIANSWWTDTMEQTAGLAQYWLGRAEARVQSFGNTINSVYKTISKRASGFKEALSNLLPSGGGRNILEIEISTSSIKETAVTLVNTAVNFGRTISSGAANMVSDLYKKIKEIAPGIGSYIAFAVTTAVGSAFAPKLFAPLLKLELIGLGAIIANELASNFGPAFISSGFLEDLGTGIGRAAGNFAAAIIENIPMIVQGLVQVVKGFGKGVAEAFGGIPGFLLRTINSIPFFGGDGLIVGLIFGTAGLSIVSKKFRELAFNVIQPALTGIIKMAGVGSGANLFGAGQGLASRILFGGTADPKAVLTRLTFFTVGATALLSGIPDTLGQGIAQLGFAYLTMFGTRGPTAIIQDLQKVANVGGSAFSTIMAGGWGTQLGATAAKAFNGIRSMMTMTSRVGAIESAKMSASYVASFARIRGAGISSLGAVVKRFGRVALIAGAALYALTGTADAASEEMGGLESTISKYSDVGIIGLSILGPMLGGPLMKAVTKVTGFVAKSISGLVSTAVATGARLGGALFTGIMAGVGSLATSIVTAITGAFAAIFSMAGAIVVGAVAAIGLLGVWIFGEGDGFFDKLGNAYDSVRKFFGMADRRTRDARNELEGLFDFDQIGDIKINLAAELANVDLSSISDDDLDRLMRVSREANRIFEEANTTLMNEGELSRAETRNVQRAVYAVRDELRRAPAVPETERGRNLGDSLKTILGGIEFIGGRTSQSLNPFGDVLTESERAALTRAQSQADEGRLSDAISTILTSEMRPMLEESDQGRALVELMGRLMGVLDAGALDRMSQEEFVTFSESVSDFSRLINQFGRGVGFNEVGAGVQAFGRGGIGNDTGLAGELAGILQTVARENARQILLEQRQAKLTNAEEILTKVADFGVDIEPEELARRFTNAQLDAFIEAGNNLITNMDIFDQAPETLAGYTQEYLDRLNHNAEMYANVLNHIIEQSVPQETTDEIQSRLEGLQSQLDSVGISGSLAFDPMVASVAALSEEAIYLGGEYERMQGKIKSISRLQRQLLEDESLSAQQRRDITVEIGRQRQSLETMVELNNLAYRIEADRVGLIEDAMSSVDDALPLERILALDVSTINKIVAASAAVQTLSLQLQSIGASGANVDVGIRRALERRLQESQEYLNSVMGGFSGNDDKSGKTETFLEKLSSGLSSAGFSASIQEIGALSQRQIDQLTIAVGRYNDAQKALNNSAQSESVIRANALRTLDEQRERMAEILASGTILGIQKALEGMGSQLDIASLVGLTPERFQFAVENSLRIAELRKNILDTAGTDLALAREMNLELERRMQLEQGMTDTARSSTDAIAESIKKNLGEVIRGAQTLGEGIIGVLDTVTDRIIDTVLNSFVDAMFQASGMKDMFTNFFAGLFQSGQSMGQKLGQTVGQSITGSLEGSMTGGGWMSNIMGSVGGLFKNIFGFLGGMGGGGGMFSSLFGLSFGSFLGFSEGGIVPMMAGAKAGVDSVPAMLTPGEVILSTDQVKALGKGSNAGNSQVFNLNITGDVSRQTRKEIVKLMPQITQGVNTNNKENNRR